MIIIKVILSVFAVIFLVDIIFNLFGGSRASDITNALCSPLFGIFYPHISMITGLLIWLIEFAFVVSCVWAWISL